MGKRRLMKKVVAYILVFTLCIGLYTPAGNVRAAEITVLETNVSSPSDGCTMLGVYGTYYTDAENALARINEIRKEACDAGNVPDPQNTSRMLTSSDYVPIKWSQALEQIARLRAVEGGIAYGFLGTGHKRLNGGSHWFAYGGVSPSAEDLAYNNGTSLVSGINQWYGEKDEWITYPNDNSHITGHYSSIINPDYKYIGLGDFYTTASSFRNTLAGELSSSCGSLGTTPLPGYTNVFQKVEVKDSYIDSYYLDGDASMYIGNTQTLTPMAKLINGSATAKLWVIDQVTYTSSDSTVATVSGDGVVTAKAKGTATITAVSKGSTLAALTISVDCEHKKVLQSETKATCTKTGTRVYKCSLCNDMIEEETAKAPHSYVYGTADSTGKATGVCSVCGDTISIVPPTSYALWWRNSQDNTGYYRSYVPADNPVGTSILCWIKDVNGQSGYQDMVIESSNPETLSVPAKILSNGTNYLEVKKGGIVRVSVYPRYNATIKKTFVIRTGEAGSVAIGGADVSLSQDSYDYSGSEKKPTPTVTYNGITLTKGTDYTVSYEDNMDVGTAKCIITGTGIFSGSVEKTFTITCPELKFTVSFDGNGASSGKMDTQDNLSYIEGGRLSVNQYEKKGFVFTGWNSKVSGNGEAYQDEDDICKLIDLVESSENGSVTLYAQWKPITYTITYHLNGGKNVNGNPKSYHVTTPTIKLKTPKRKGYKFGGWYSDAKYKKKVTFITRGSTGNKKLYAKWTKQKYKITYKLNKGKNNRKNPKKYYVTTATIKLKNPKRKGYIFKGWYMDKKFKKRVTKITRGSTGNKVLYAKWKKKK